MNSETGKKSNILTKSTQKAHHNVEQKKAVRKFNQSAESTRIKKILTLLEQQYPDVECALNYKTPYQLLVATILSAQCTDIMVNKVTPALFTKAPDAKSMVKLSQPQLETIIHPTGFFVNKAKNILAMSHQLMEHFNGIVPNTLNELITLPGVGRKTASVVLGVAFQIAEGIVVDTHVSRLSQRLGFTKQTDATKIERDLMKIIPNSAWINFSHQLIHHGRQVCNARKPLCEKCLLSALCPSAMR